jgi:lipid-binding SYLF domain-containing protein
MTKHMKFMKVVFLVALATATLTSLRPAFPGSAEGIDRDVQAALKALYGSTPAAKALGEKAKAVLVFPNIVKAGFVVGVQGGDGALLKKGKTVGYYNTAGVSYGLQAGAQSFGYALFFMSDSALDYLAKSKGWEIGVGPSVVVVDEGMARTLTTTTAKNDIYAFLFNQKGLMAGAGLQGSKITKISQ